MSTPFEVPEGRILARRNGQAAICFWPDPTGHAVAYHVRHGELFHVLPEEIDGAFWEAVEPDAPAEATPADPAPKRGRFATSLSADPGTDGVATEESVNG